MHVDVESAELDVRLNAGDALLGAIPQIAFEHRDAWCARGRGHAGLVARLRGLGCAPRERRSFISHVLRVETGSVRARGGRAECASSSSFRPREPVRP
ncbi:MAG TPA: hypothetical protein VGC30_05025 [Dokdonella sp.]